MQDFKFYLKCENNEIMLESECTPTDLALALAHLYRADENILQAVRASLYAYELTNKRDNKS